MNGIKHAILALRESISKDEASTRDCLLQICALLDRVNEEVDKAHNKIDNKNRSGGSSGFGSSAAFMSTEEPEQYQSGEWDNRGAIHMPNGTIIRIDEAGNANFLRGDKNEIN